MIVKRMIAKTYKMKKNKLFFLVVIFLFLYNQTNSQVGLYKVSLKEQINKTTLIVEGKVIFQKSFWDSGHKKIYTSNTIEIYKTFKGETATETIELITIGGTVEETTLTLSHSLQLKVGEFGVFLLTDFNKLLPNNVGNRKKYKTYAGLQGFYKFELNLKKVTNIFEKYSDIENDFYPKIITITKKRFKEIKKITNNSKNSGNNKTQLVPFISNFSPTTSNAGTGEQITITGFSFGSVKGKVQFSDGNDGGATFTESLDSEITNWTNNSITVRVPSRAGTGVIRVLANGSTAFTQSNAKLTIPYAIINRSGFITQHYDTNGKGGYTFSMSSDFNNNIAKNPFLRAFNTWVCATGVNWVISSNTTFSSEFAKDGINVIAFDTPGDELDPGVLGGTLNWTTNCANGSVIDEIDFIFDNERTDWQYGPALATSNQLDFETVVLHEFGHAHALAHVISPGALMHWSVSNGNNVRNLSPTDLDAGNFLHNLSVNNIICSKPTMTSIESCTALGLNKDLLSNSIKVYPNPTNGNLFIENLSERSLDKISVYDTKGKLIYETKIANKKIMEIYLYSMSKGVYFVKIYSDKSVITKKLVLN